MRDKFFYSIIAVICLVGMVLTGLLIKYTIDLRENMSITSYISNEE